jgi:hypothetical protein
MHEHEDAAAARPSRSAAMSGSGGKADGTSVARAALSLAMSVRTCVAPIDDDPRAAPPAVAAPAIDAEAAAGAIASLIVDGHGDGGRRSDDDDGAMKTRINLSALDITAK